MIIADVQKEIGTRLETVGLRAFPYSADRISPPAAIVALPEEITFDLTYGRGSDRLSVALYVVVGRSDARTSNDRLSAYLDGSGASSVKAVVESGTYTAFDSVQVKTARPGSFTIGGVEYLGAEFTLDITGSN